MENFSERLEKILDYYSLTASALADEIDFNRSTISHLISGRNRPSLDFVMKLMKKFPELNLEWLVTGKGHFPPSIEKAGPQKSNSASLVSDDAFVNRETITKSPSLINAGEIDKIVFFYTDGSFKVYEN